MSPDLNIFSNENAKRNQSYFSGIFLRFSFGLYRYFAFHEIIKQPLINNLYFFFKENAVTKGVRWLVILKIIF
jgi:hypothetical protein